MTIPWQVRPSGAITPEEQAHVGELAWGSEKHSCSHPPLLLIQGLEPIQGNENVLEI